MTTSLNNYQNGVGNVSGNQLNTFVQDCATISVLRSFVGITGIQVYVQGFTSPGDGGQGNFWWNASAISPVDDGKNIIVPPAAGQGCWQRLDGNPIGLLTAPAIPISTVALVNPFPYAALVTITGGTVSVITVGTTVTGLTSGTVVLAIGQTITLTYSAAPTWVWFGLGY